MAIEQCPLNYRQLTPALANMAPADLNMAPAVLNMTPADLNMAPAVLNTTPAELNMATADVEIAPAGAGMVQALLENATVPGENGKEVRTINNYRFPTSVIRNRADMGGCPYGSISYMSPYLYQRRYETLARCFS
ncbi:MAG: hypothetical protein NT166_14680 [Candidatus Aminicenantes bacterium]|nr:hypothetical protein [Candidatus Aminicenantes bacterium]